MNKYRLGVMAWLILLLLACSPQPRMLNDAEKTVVLAYSETKTENLLLGIQRNDYALFSRDLNDQMKNAIDKNGLGKLRAQVTDKIGNCVARQVERVEEINGNLAVVYRAKFEGDDPVAMRVVFETGEPHRISGLWFDSAKLRQR